MAKQNKINENKLKLIENLKKHKELFMKELEKKYYVYADSVDDIWIFGENGFDDSECYTNVMDKELTDEEIDQMEKLYIEADDLVEVYNGEVQCIMRVNFEEDEEGVKISILETEAHHGIFDLEFGKTIEIKSVSMGGQYLWFDDGDGFRHKVFWDIADASEIDIDEIIKSLEEPDNSHAAKAAGFASITPGDKSSYCYILDESEGKRYYVLKPETKQTDLALADFFKENKEAIKNVANEKSWGFKLEGFEEKIIHLFKSKKEIEDFAKKHGAELVAE